LFNHSPELWKEFQLESNSGINGDVKMWKRSPNPIPNAIYMKFSSFFPDISPGKLFPLLAHPTKRGWDPNFEEYREVERLAPNSWVIYGRSIVPHWLSYLRVQKRDYVQKITVKHDSDRDRYLIIAQSTNSQLAPEVQNITRADLVFQGTLIEPHTLQKVNENGFLSKIYGTKVTVLSVNDIKVGPQLVRLVTRVMKRYPLRWYSHLSAATGHMVTFNELTWNEFLYFLLPPSY
jgi:hypothetical protein